MSNIDGNLVVQGHFSSATMTLPSACVYNASVAADAAIERSKLQQDDNKPYPIPLSEWRVWDAPASVLPATSATDDLGLYNGTFGTTPWYVGTSDLKNAGATVRYARCQVMLPPEYVDAQTVTIRLAAGMITTAASATATIDVEAFEVGSTGAMGSDLCTTAAASINSTTFADKDFIITATDLVAGDIIDIRVTIAVNDTATATAVIGAFRKSTLLCDVKG